MIGLILFLMSLFAGLTILSVGFEIFGVAMDVFGPLITIGIFVYIIRLFTNKNKKTDSIFKTRTASAPTSRTNPNEAKFIKALDNHFKSDARLLFDQETYLTPLSEGPITLDNVGIYMRDEYISTLSEYKIAFPNSYNTFVDMILNYTSSRNASRSKPVSNTPKETQTKSTYLKDAQYYIDSLSKMNESIDQETITEHLNKSVQYLSQIRDIEKTFPKSKDKTTKLYQYYLPMLLDILENYKRLSVGSTQSKEFKENEDRLLKTLVLINGALDTLTHTLLEEYYTESSVDMKTLEALLKKDGLVQDEMTFENFKQSQEKKVESNG